MVTIATNTGTGARITAFRRKSVCEAGFTYLGLLAMVLIMEVVMAGAGVVWHIAMKREKEQELLFVGDQFRQAIKLYYVHSPAQGRHYPAQLEDLLRDPRYPSIQRYLRKVYVDPIRGDTNWGLVKGADGGILGVHSLSMDEPVKKGNFSVADAEFAGKSKYADWEFIYVPKQYQASMSQRY